MPTFLGTYTNHIMSFSELQTAHRAIFSNSFGFPLASGIAIRRTIHAAAAQAHPPTLPFRLVIANNDPPYPFDIAYNTTAHTPTSFSIHLPLPPAK